MFRRSSLILGLLVGGLGLTLTAAVPEATASGGNYYEMFCRGPFVLTVGTTHKVSAKKNTTRAGAGGSELAPGTCAWRNRPLNSGEQTQIKFNYSGSILSDLKTSSAATALVACSLSSNCVFRTKVRNAGDGTMEAGSQYAVTLHPHD